MKKNNRFILMVVIIIALACIRVAIPSEKGVDTYFMTWVNIVALDLVVFDIATLTYSKMEDEHEKKGKDKVDHIKVNKSMKSFKMISYILLILFIVISVLYALTKGDTVVNDILTIVALVFSMEADNIVDFLFEKCYSYY